MPLPEIDYNAGIDRNASKPFDVMGASGMQGAAAHYAKSNDMLGKKTTDIGKTAGKVGKGASVVGDSAGLIGQGASAIKDIGLSTTERMDDKGATTHKVNAGGKIVGMAAAGAKLGSNFGPWGTVIGGAVGAVGGGVMAGLDAFKQPDFADANNQRNRFDMGLQIGAISNNDTQPQQTQAAAQGRKDVQGTKQFEVEKNEIVLRKIGRVYKKVADFKGGKSHAQGGEDYIANDGDIIMPGKKRLAVDKALRTRDWKKIESIRQALPADSEKMVAAKGVKDVMTTTPSKRKARWDKFLAQPGVKDKVISMSEKYGFSPSDLMAVFDLETSNTLDPSIKNPKSGSTASGLIQFVEATANELGTTTKELRGMTASEQLDYVDKYYDKYQKYGDHPYDIVVGASSGRLEDKDIMYKKGSPQADGNPTWQDENGNVTKESARNATKDFYVPDYLGFENSVNGPNEFKAVDTYEDYVKKIKAIGKEPQTAEWYKANVTDPAAKGNEKETTAPVLSFEELKKKAEAEGLPAPKPNPRGDAAIGDSLATMSDADFDKKMKSDVQFRGIRYASDPESQAVMAGKMLREMNMSISPAAMIGEKYFNTSAKLWNLFHDKGDKIETDEVAFTDPKMEKELDGFKKYLNNADIPSDIMNALRTYGDVQTYLLSGQSNAANKPAHLAEILAGEDPKDIAKWLKGAQDEGYISRKGAWVIRDFAKTPNKTWTSEMTGNMGVDVAAVLANPKGIINMFKNGGKTIKLATGIVKAEDAMKALKYLKGSGQKLISDIYHGVLGSKTYKGEKTVQELIDLGKQFDDAKVPPLKTVGKTTSNTWAETFKNAGEFIKKLPQKMHERMIGKSMEEVSKIQRDVTQLTGKSTKEVLAMKPEELGLLLAKKQTEIKEGLKTFTESKALAAEKYSKAKQVLTEAKSALVEARKPFKGEAIGAVKAAGGGEAELEAVYAAERAVTETEGVLKSALKKQTLNSENWANASLLESIVKDARATDEVDVIGPAMKRYNAAMDAIFKSGDVPAEVATALKNDQEAARLYSKALVEGKDPLEAVMKYGKVVQAESDAHTAGGIVEATKGAKASATTSLARVTNMRKTLDKFPESVKLLSKEANFWDDVKSGAVGTAQVLNLLRDRQVDPIEIAKIEEGFTADPVEPTTPEATTPDAIDTTPTPVDTKKQEEVSKQIGGSVTPYKEAPAEIPAGDEGGSGERKIGERLAGGFSALASYAPAIYNIVRGLEDPDKVKRRFVTPQTRVFQPMDQPQLNAIENAFSTAVGNARNLSGGMMSNFRSNTEKSWADKIARTGQVNAQEAQRADQVATQNIGIRNKADQYNTQANARYDEIDQRSEAATNSFLAQGVQDVANITSRNKTDRLKGERDNKMMKLMNTGDYKYNQDSGEIEYTGNSSKQRALPKSNFSPDAFQNPIEIDMPDFGVDAEVGSKDWRDNFKY
jgi:hypothetical protein